MLNNQYIKNICESLDRLSWRKYVRSLRETVYDPPIRPEALNVLMFASNDLSVIDANDVIACRVCMALERFNLIYRTKVTKESKTYYSYKLTRLGKLFVKSANIDSLADTVIDGYDANHDGGKSEYKHDQIINMTLTSILVIFLTLIFGVLSLIVTIPVCFSVSYIFVKHLSDPLYVFEHQDTKLQYDHLDSIDHSPIYFRNLDALVANHGLLTRSMFVAFVQHHLRNHDYRFHAQNCTLSLPLLVDDALFGFEV